MKRSNGKTKRVILSIMGLCCLVLFCVSSYMVVTRLIHERREEKAFEDLAAQLPERAPLPDSQEPQEPSTPDEPSAPSDPSGSPGGETPPGGETSPGGGDTEDDGLGNTLLDAPTKHPHVSAASRYEALHKQNPDMFGWICIEGTDINFPVMHTPDDPEHYLHRAFDGSYSYRGVPFLAWNCYTDCGNYIVYGHHMTNGTMFATLMKYANESWWEEHPVIQFDTIEEYGDYEVLSAFYAQVYHVNEEGVFKYYAYNELTDKETFDEFVRQAKESALYDTGVDATFGDQLLTLITCNDHTKNGRFVVIARRAQDPEDAPDTDADANTDAAQPQDQPSGE